MHYISAYSSPDETPISARTVVNIGYGADRMTDLLLMEWYRPEWEKYIGQFAGYDPEKGPLLTSGRYIDAPINWWQHPCVEEEDYRLSNGGEVHLYLAHLASYIFIPPMSPEQVARCKQEDVGVVGAHVYFDKTVIYFEPSSKPGNPYNKADVLRAVVNSLQRYK